MINDFNDAPPAYNTVTREAPPPYPGATAAITSTITPTPVGNLGGIAVTPLARSARAAKMYEQGNSLILILYATLTTMVALGGALTTYIGIYKKDAQNYDNPSGVQSAGASFIVGGFAAIMLCALIAKFANYRAYHRGWYNHD